MTRLLALALLALVLTGCGERDWRLLRPDAEIAVVTARAAAAWNDSADLGFEIVVEGGIPVRLVDGPVRGRGAGTFFSKRTGEPLRVLLSRDVPVAERFAVLMHELCHLAAGARGGAHNDAPGVCTSLPDLDALPNAADLEWLGVAAEASDPAQRPPNVDVPLCEGEDDWQPGECQRLVHSPRTGYCNRWIPCDEL